MSKESETINLLLWRLNLDERVEEGSFITAKAAEIIKKHYIEASSLSTSIPQRDAPKERVIERTCRNCKFSGWDPDGPYCVHREALKTSSFGLSLSSRTIAKLCPAPSHPLYEQKESK